MGRARVCSVGELQPGMSARVELNGTPVAVFNVEGELYAIGDTCSHEEASLSEGFVDEDTVECPKHGAVFHIPTGDVRSLPATHAVPRFAVVVDGEDVFVEA